ncbi:MAG: VWA domain-containing protein [Acidobacteria bacterium]|nr:VWA domain-containing protein [Acidobacteriota bacterium]
MPNRKLWMPVMTVLLAAFLVSPAIRMVGAQDPPQPPSPRQKPETKDPKQKQGDRRQGAQADDPALDKDSTIKLDTDLVLLDVTVVDQNNQPVFDLTKNDFEVYEDRIKQTIEEVSREEVPVSFGMVIDTSGSMRSKLQIVSDAALDLIKQMRQDDEAFLAQFKAEPELVQDFSSDRRELEDALGEMFTSGGTSLLDAIIATSDYAQEKGKQRRKALIVITDGLEKNSSVKEKEVMEAIKENEVQVYLVGFIDEEEDQRSFFGRSPAKKAKELLSRLADDSGGRAFFPKDLSEMPQIAAQISKDLRTQYVMSYYPTNDKRDGTFRSLKVQVNQKGGRKMFARTRQGYYARNASGQLPTAARRNRGVSN